MTLVGPALLAVPTSTSTVTAASTPNLRINEVLAANTRIAHAGTFPDLIELHNAGSTAVDLSGKSLSDDPLLPRKFVFPAGTSIPAGGYLLVYADSELTAPGLHTDFSLDAEGDQVRLYDTPANGGVLLDSIVFGFQIPNYSVARTGAGANIWALTAPTPAAANGSAVGLAAPAGVKINEWAGKITFRLDHDLIELFNSGAQPVAIGGVRLTDDVNRPTRFTFPPLSFIDATGFLPLYGADFVFGLDGDRETITLFGENNEQIDQVVVLAQAVDRSGGRSPDGAATIVALPVPTPGLPNSTPLPAAYQPLLDNLRITEVMYQPAAPANSSDYEFIELQNIGSTPLDLSGVRFTNGISHTFPTGTTLAPGALLVVVNDRSSFLSRYPGSTGFMAAGGFNGSFDNTGETIALTLPEPWRVHILRFRFEPTWYPSASGGGHSIVVAAPATTLPKDWQERTVWRASANVNGSPGAAEAGTPPPAGTTARLANLSVRTAMAAGQTLIMGFTLQGGSKSILLRAVGPGLAPFGVSGTMSDPRLALFKDAGQLDANDNWGGTSALSAAFASVGAFALPPASLDAALLRAMDGGQTAQVTGTGAGVVLVEAYDAGTGNSPRLVNVSARNRVGTGDDILIAGFNIAGSGTKQLLVRAVGPSLSAFGVVGTLSDPKLEIYSDAGVKLTENDNWAASLAPTFSAVGAFALTAGSRDAALLTTLATGSYTVQVSGVGGGTGEGLIEIYEVP
ncbi:MAG: lamin tail domain-containing protein [Opitutaceae bacterium]|nr:lamin tail domain-containing protein [Opitutaceae bacterium]